MGEQKNAYQDKPLYLKGPVQLPTSLHIDKFVADGRITSKNHHHSMRRRVSSPKY